MNKPKLRRRRRPSRTDLVEVLSKSLVAIEGTLFRQASIECQRLNGLTNFLSHLEARLFSPEVLEQLDLSERLTLYREARKSQELIINFLNKLHNLSLDTQTVLTYINELEQQQRKEQKSSTNLDIDSTQAKQIKQAILDLLKQRKSS
jgi:hypothetical protein